MITTQEEAAKHSSHAKGKNIVVLPCGQIYTGSDDFLMQKLIDNNDDCFIVKGDLIKKVKEVKKKNNSEIVE